MTTYQDVVVQGHKLLCHDANSRPNSTVVVLRGFRPSHTFRDLISELSNHFHTWPLTILASAIKTDCDHIVRTMGNYPEIREEQRVISLILAGQNQLFHELIRPYEHVVYRMALSFVHNEADAEEIAQEAFLKAFCKLAGFRGEARFGTWLISITLNEARSLIRRNRLASTESLDTTPAKNRRLPPGLLRDWKEIPSEAVQRLEINFILQQAIASLPKIYREVLRLREEEELNTKEVAEALQISISSARVRLYRARMMMQKIIAPQLKQVRPKTIGSDAYKIQTHSELYQRHT